MKEIKKIQTNWNILYVHKSEELMLLKCPYYPKPSNNSSSIKIPKLEKF